MPLTEASALGSLYLEKFESQRDRDELKNLAQWCEQFSPSIAIEEPDCLFMNVTGLIPIFGSEQSLVTQMRRAFKKRRLTTRIAITDTYSAAWGLAHYRDRPVIIVPPGDVVSAMSPLPIAALNLTEQIESTLQELGIEFIGQLAALSRKSLASRFEPELLDRLDRVTGLLRETTEAHRAPPDFARCFELESPIANRMMLGNIVIELITQIVPALISLQEGITEFVCEFIEQGQPAIRMPVALYQPTINIKHLSELALLQLENLKLVGPISKIRLLVCSTARLQVAQLELFDEENFVDQKRKLSLLVNRLSSRLGQSSVLRPALVADAEAEFAYRYYPLTETQRRTKPKPVKQHKSLERPIHLLPKLVALRVVGMAQGPPKQFQWRGQTFTVEKTSGPERIQTGWWRGRYEMRDYYRVETAEGNRFWLFHRADGVWFLHGIFD